MTIFEWGDVFECVEWRAYYSLPNGHYTTSLYFSCYFNYKYIGSPGGHVADAHWWKGLRDRSPTEC